jgi:hypothetical protein
MRMQRWVLGTLLVTWTAGCAAPMPVQPVMPATTTPFAAAPLSAPDKALATADKALVTAPGKALVTAPGKALATPEKALAKPAAPLAPVAIAPIMALDDIDPVMAVANVAVTMKVTADTQADVTSLAIIDEELTAKQLSVSSLNSFATKGWFSDLKDKFNTWNEKRKLKKEAKKQLKDNDDFVAKQQATKISWLKKNRDEPTVTTNQLPDGGKEVTSVWTDGKGPKTATVTLKQVFDDEGVEQSALLTELGNKSNGQSWETIRSRKLLDENGTREVYTKRTETDKKGRAEIHEFTKVIKADRTETITGTITNRNGKVTTISGTRSADGKLTINEATTTAAPPEKAATPDW